MKAFFVNIWVASMAWLRSRYDDLAWRLGRVVFDKSGLIPMCMEEEAQASMAYFYRELLRQPVTFNVL